MPVMQENDRQTLERICGGKIPQATIDRYFIWQRAKALINNGPFSPEALIILADSTNALAKPAREPHPCDSWPIGSFVSVVDPDIRTREICQGTFEGVDEELLKGQVKVAFFGSKERIRTYSPRQVMLLKEEPAWAALLREEQENQAAGEEGAPPPAAAPAKPQTVIEDAPPHVPLDHEPSEQEVQLRERKLAAMKKVSWSQFAKATQVKIVLPGKKPCIGWFIEVDEDTFVHQKLYKIRVRLPRGRGRTETDKIVAPMFVKPVRDDEGRHIVDMEGFLAAEKTGPAQMGDEPELETESTGEEGSEVQDNSQAEETTFPDEPAGSEEAA